VHSEEDGCYRLERAYGAFRRTIPMPEEADGVVAYIRARRGGLTFTRNGRGRCPC
jgi:HSP20 family protein